MAAFAADLSPMARIACGGGPPPAGRASARGWGIWFAATAGGLFFFFLGSFFPRLPHPSGLPLRGEGAPPPPPSSGPRGGGEPPRHIGPRLGCDRALRDRV